MRRAFAVLSAILVAVAAPPQQGSLRAQSFSVPLRPPLRAAAAIVLPGAPSSLSFVVTGRTVTLSWNAPVSGDPPASYVLEAGSASGRSDLAAIDTGSPSTGFVANSVAPGTYFVRVRARNSSGTGAPSNEITVIVSVQVAAAFVVNSIAGSGPPNVGDGGAATSAVLESPGAVVAASDGAVYIVDTNNDRVRQLKGGVIRTVAGTGTSEDRTLGNGGPATQANLRIPRDLAIGADGTAYIADSNHYLIRRVDQNGLISTFAGNRQFTYGGDGGLATAASFSFPIAVAVDDVGNVYVADQLVHRVRRIRLDGIIETIAGTGEAGSDGDNGPARLARITSPTSLAIRNRTGLLIAGPGPLRMVDLTTGVITTVGPSLGAHVALDGDRSVLVSNGVQVTRLDLASGATSRVAGAGQSGFGGDGGRAESALLDDVRGLSVDARGVIYLADAGNQRVRRVDTAGIIETVAGSGVLPGDNTTSAQAVIYDSQGITSDGRGNIYFTDFLHNTIRRRAPDGRVSTVAGNRRGTWAGDGGHPLSASFSAPRGLQFDHHGQLLFLDETRGVAVVRAITPGADGVIDGSADERIFTVAGRMADRSEADHGAADGRPATQAVFVGARGFAVDSRDNLYVADWLDNRIRRVTPGSDGVLNNGSDEIITTVAGTGLTPSSGDGGPSRQANVSAPNWISIDPADNVFLFEENPGNQAVRRIDGATGIITTIMRSREIWSMTAPTSQDLYFADATQFYHLDLRTGSVTAIAGSADSGFDGDGGDALLAHFRGAGYFTIDAAGTFLFVDNGNFKLRQLNPR